MQIRNQQPKLRLSLQEIHAFSPQRVHALRTAVEREKGRVMRKKTTRLASHPMEGKIRSARWWKKLRSGWLRAKGGAQELDAC